MILILKNKESINNNPNNYIYLIDSQNICLLNSYQFNKEY